MKIPLRHRLVLSAALLAAAPAYAIDPFSTGSLVSSTRAGVPGRSDAPACDAQTRLPTILTLAAAIDLALCNSPQTGRGWANAKAQAAQVGIAKAGYLPTVTAGAGYQREKDRTRVDDHPELDNDINSSARTATLSMNLVLFDFGARQANLDSARALLAAANAGQDIAVQTVFIGAAQSYYNAMTARSALLAIKIAKTLAEQTFESAQAKYQIGLATMVDKLQAETAFAQEGLRLVKAQGAFMDALGNLAVTMGFPSNTQITLDSSEETRLPDTEFVKSIDALLESAKLSHPGLQAARAQLRAARANEASIRASGYPTVSLTGNANRATQPTSQLGLPPLTTASRGYQVGLQLNIPLFEGFSRTYRSRQAEAQTESRAADLADAELQVSMEVWKNYQALHTATEELKLFDQFTDSASKTVAAAKVRYKLGASELIELLSAQTMLASAQQQRIESLAEWRTARLRLAYSLGLLGRWAVN